MKKSRLQLNRRTIRRLDIGLLGGAVGGTGSDTTPAQCKANAPPTKAGVACLTDDTTGCSADDGLNTR